MKLKSLLIYHNAGMSVKRKWGYYFNKHFFSMIDKINKNEIHTLKDHIRKVQKYYIKSTL